MQIIKRLSLSVLCLSCITVSPRAQIISDNQSYALIFPTSGDGYSAAILRIERDSLIVYTNTISQVAKKDISKIILHKKGEGARGFVIGSILGIYGMNYFLGTANGQPGGFLWSNIYGSRYTNDYSNGTALAIVGIAFLGVLTGGGIGYLLDSQHESESEVTYIFGGPPELQEDEWTKLQAAVEHSVRRSKWHLGISGALVFPQIGNAARSQLTGEGYVLGSSYSGSSNYLSGFDNLQTSSDFNWLRSISLAYSATENLRIGVNYALLGEPSFVYTKGNTFTSGASQTYSIGQRIDGKGYYATLGYERMFGTNQDFELNVTAGIGFAISSFDQTAVTSVDSSFRIISTSNDNISIRKTSFSGMISAGVSYYIYDSMSFGLTGSYYYGGQMIARAMPFVPINQQTVTIGNADIGFTIGLHF